MKPTGLLPKGTKEGPLSLLPGKIINYKGPAKISLYQLQLEDGIKFGFPILFRSLLLLCICVCAVRSEAVVQCRKLRQRSNGFRGFTHSKHAQKGDGENAKIKTAKLGRSLSLYNHEIMPNYCTLR